MESAELESPESEQKQEEQQDPYASRGYWQRWITAAKKGADQHWKDAKAAWDEFEHQAGDNPARLSAKTASYPIYWSSVKTIEPAYYSRTPKLNATRLFGINDPVALTASLISERYATYLINGCGFDSVMQAAVGDFIHADKATVQLVYTHDVEEQEKRFPLTQVKGGFYDDSSDSLYEGEVFSDAPGQFFYIGKEQIATNKKIKIAPAHYDEILHDPDARSEDEIKNKAFFFSLCEDEAKNRFSPETIAKVQWKIGKSYGNDKDAEHSDVPGKIIEGWEIHCLSNKRVYWYSEQVSDELLDIKDDPYELRSFFPCPPFIIGSKPSKSLYPTPAYIHMRDVIIALHEQQHKVYELIKAVRRRALIDGSVPEVAAAFEEAGDNEFIVVKNLQAILEKGGIANLVQWLPVAELVSAIGELNSLEDKFKNSFYEWFGVPDILRGASDPIETAAAQEIKQASAHDRFKFQKKQIAMLARDAIELMQDLGYAINSDEEMAQIVGLQYMQPEDQERFPAAMALLRNDEARIVRIEVDTDSLSFLDDQLKQQRTNVAVQTVTQALKTIAEMAQGDPSFLPVGLHAVLLSLESLQAGKQFEDGVKKAVETLIKAKENPPPPPPPPPDYEKMKLELQGQKQQMDGMNKQRELEGKEAKMALDAQKQLTDTQLEKQRAILDAATQEFAMQIESMRVQLEQFQVQMQARETQMEEIRLAAEADKKLSNEQGAGNGGKSVGGAVYIMPPGTEIPQPPPMPPPAPPAPETMKELTVIRDENGNATGYKIRNVPVGAETVPSEIDLGSML